MIRFRGYSESRRGACRRARGFCIGWDLDGLEVFGVFLFIWVFLYSRGFLGGGKRLGVDKEVLGFR